MRHRQSDIAKEQQASEGDGLRERIQALMDMNSALLGKDYARSVELCRQAVSLAEELQDDAVTANCHIELARACWKVGDMVEAQHHYDRCRVLNLKMGDHGGLGQAYCGLGIVHGALNDHANAIEFFEKGAQASERAGDDVTLAHNLGNLGMVHRKLNDYTTALRYFARALAIDRALGEAGRQGVANMLTAIAGVMVFQGEYEGAITKLEEALVLHEQTGNPRGMATTYSNIGLTYDKMGQQAHAITYLNRALAMAESIHYKVLVPELHQNLSDLYAAIGDDDEALRHIALRKEFMMEEKRLEVQRQAGRIMDGTAD